MTQSNFDYININSDSSEEEEENEFKDKFFSCSSNKYNRLQYLPSNIL
jgi:hypothetical protein